LSFKYGFSGSSRKSRIFMQRIRSSLSFSYSSKFFSVFKMLILLMLLLEFQLLWPQIPNAWCWKQQQHKHVLFFRLWKHALYLFVYRNRISWGTIRVTKVFLRLKKFSDRDENNTMLEWLEQDLIKANTNRKNVPWIFAGGHRPLYSAAPTYTSDGHPVGYYEALQHAVEPMFLKYGVDVFFQVQNK